MSELVTNEIFGPTIQGEGPSAGQPAIFLRLALCNLSCWWCDTPYSWAFTKAKARDHQTEKLYSIRDETKKRTLQEVREYVEHLRSKLHHFRLVITGGEPMMQQERIWELLDGWDALQGIPVEIETNGTLYPKIPKMVERVHFNVSPKLSGSQVAQEKRIIPDALKRFNELPNTIFKFVVADRVDGEELEQLVSELELNPQKIWLMAAGADRVEQLVQSPWVAEYAIAQGWNYTPRLQVLLWDTQRAV